MFRNILSYLWLVCVCYCYNEIWLISNPRDTNYISQLTPAWKVVELIFIGLSTHFGHFLIHIKGWEEILLLLIPGILQAWNIVENLALESKFNICFQKMKPKVYLFNVRYLPFILPMKVWVNFWLTLIFMKVIKCHIKFVKTYSTICAWFCTMSWNFFWSMFLILHGTAHFIDEFPISNLNSNPAKTRLQLLWSKVHCNQIRRFHKGSIELSCQNIRVCY